MIKELKNKILNGYFLNKPEALSIINENFSELCLYADEIRNKFCGNNFDICSIINGKNGKCSENCKYCAQSSYYKTTVKGYPLLDRQEILKEAKYNAGKGILRFSVVTSGRTLNREEVDKLCHTYRIIKNNSNISLCGSHGLLSYQDFIKLKKAGLSRYHCNLETSKKNFKNICTTHTYTDKINTIKAAQQAGLEVCSGGIIGMGETFEDRIDMFFELHNLNIKSIPINILNPIKDTPFEKIQILSQEEVCKTIALARFIIPDAFIRLAGGRGLFKDKGKRMFMSGANSAISGNMLTTSGILIDEDLKTIKELGFNVKNL